MDIDINTLWILGEEMRVVHNWARDFGSPGCRQHTFCGALKVFPKTKAAIGHGKVLGSKGW